MDKTNGGTPVHHEVDSSTCETGGSEIGTRRRGSKNRSEKDRMPEAPLIDFHDAAIMEEDNKLKNNQTEERFTQILGFNQKKDDDGQEYLEGMPVLTLEIEQDAAELEDEEENLSIAGIKTSYSEVISPVSTGNRIGDNSFQKGYDADTDESRGTSKFQAEESNQLKGSVLCNSFGATNLELSRNFVVEKESVVGENTNLVSADSPATAVSSTKERRKRKPRSELDRLLMDEGTVRILLGQPKAENSRGGSTRMDKLNELQKKRDLVINQVRDSSRTKLFNKVSLRTKTKTKRQQSEEKRNSGKKSKIATETASKIIRRRSSSCSFNFSSRSPSPLPMSAPLESSSQDSIQVQVQGGTGHISIDSEGIIFNTQIASRLNSILNGFKLDGAITVVELVTTSDFIQGLDIKGIRGEADDSLRESMADSMIACLDTLLKTLITYPKLLIAGVQGEALDFGVLILSYFDIVYASDKATFRTNYGNNGYLPECLQFFPKNRLTHAMLYTGKKLSASEAATSGLITEVVPASKFSDEIANRIKLLAASNQQYR